MQLLSPNETEGLRLALENKGSTSDDLSRKVYGLLGIPIDAIDFPVLMETVRVAGRKGLPYLISTPNVNFLVKSQTNREFRESMLLSDLCLADGMPLIWIAKLLKIPILERVAGADLFGRLKTKDILNRTLNVFLLGGATGVVEIVAQKLNQESLVMKCVGALNPGFGSIDEISSAEVIEAINASSADLLAVFFGAEKAQAWLLHNHHRLTVPIRAQFGATINFEAGTVKRAPRFVRGTGFEWLWRIKEEPYLWRRYWSDGKALVGMLITGVLPLMLSSLRGRRLTEFYIERQESMDFSIIKFYGAAVAAHANEAVTQFREALMVGKPVMIDISNTQYIDARFFGLFLMARKRSERGENLPHNSGTDFSVPILRMAKSVETTPCIICEIRT
jgi:N-acetylglucosaminyldiphosphoundecaprenol N-acetyl-beta-D-mannosaminyltransferase